jgi:hypothetical protein
VNDDKQTMYLSPSDLYLIMPYCPNCGSPVNDDDRFCSSCGAPRVSDSPPPQITPEPEEIRWTNTVFMITSDYYVNREGGGLAASSGSSNLTTGITVAGALLGSMTAAGAGMIAKSRENDFIAWNDARSVALNSKKKTVTITRKSLVFPIRLYCTDANYQQVEAYIRKYVNPSLIKG